jgi:hypothetical protein
VQAAWFQAYEVGIDQKTRTEIKRNLLAIDEQQQSTSTIQGTSRGKMVHTTLKQNDRDSWVALGLNENGFVTEQVLYLIERAKFKSANFDIEMETPKLTNNKSILFFKLHLLTEENRLVSLTIVDLAGYPDQRTKMDSMYS